MTSCQENPYLIQEYHLQMTVRPIRKWTVCDGMKRKAIHIRMRSPGVLVDLGVLAFVADGAWSQFEKKPGGAVKQSCKI